ncbi:hypothetical protein T492DRAFT_1091333 [Pavlovales sp. CCMP2436]|nr:hypothetical protein T492DRAFT_1091333 [Pavlovales sp. CCMP2436]
MSVHVRGRATDPDAQPGWYLALGPLQLMADAHAEDDAQEWHSIELSAPRLAPPEWHSSDLVHAMRLTYMQQSPLWADFGVRHLACFTRESMGAATRAADDRPAGGEFGELLTHMGNVLVSAERAAALVRLADDTGNDSGRMSSGRVYRS